MIIMGKGGGRGVLSFPFPVQLLWVLVILIVVFSFLCYFLLQKCYLLYVAKLSLSFATLFLYILINERDGEFFSSSLSFIIIHNTADSGSMQGAGHIRTQLNGLSLYEFS